MIKKIFKFLISLLSEIYIFESKSNKKKIKYRNFYLKKYKSLKQIKSSGVINHLNDNHRYLRFKKKQILFVLFHKKQAVSLGWMNKGSRWFITEINRTINISNTTILYDFFTFPKLRNKGYYIKILKLIKNIKIKNFFLIYTLDNNEKSKKGIIKAKFVLIGKMKRFS